MIADIFTLYSPYWPPFKPALYEKEKQNCLGVSYPRLHQGTTLDPQLQLFLTLPKTMRPYFFNIIPWLSEVKLVKNISKNLQSFNPTD